MVNDKINSSSILHESVKKVTGGLYMKTAGIVSELIADGFIDAGDRAQIRETKRLISEMRASGDIVKSIAILWDKRQNQIREEIADFAYGRKVTNADVLAFMRNQSLWFESKVFETNVKKIIADLRRAGDIISAKSVRNVWKDAIQEYLSPLTYAVGPRNICYHLVGRGLIEKSDAVFQKVGAEITRMRERGEIPWDSVADSVRNYSYYDVAPTASDPAKVVAQGYESIRDIPTAMKWAIEEAFPDRFDDNIWENTFANPKWHNQPYYVEVWVEKEGIVPSIQGICQRWEVPLVSARGQASATIVKKSAENYDTIVREYSRRPYILYYGDFDESGLDIPKSLRNRWNGLNGCHRYCEVAKPIVDMRAGKYEHIEQYDLITRAPKDRLKLGYDQAFEIDAYAPDDLRDMIDSDISEFFDQSVANANVAEEAAKKKEVAAAYSSASEEYANLREILPRIADEVEARIRKEL